MSDLGARPPRALRAAVIGTGKISEEHLGFISTSPQANLVGVCDMSPVMARFTGERFGAESWYADVDEMLDRARPDIVHVLTPPHTHAVLARKALAAGAHVIAEKPITLDHASLIELADLAEASGLVLTEDHNYLFNRPMVALQHLIAEGRIGDVREVEVRISVPLSPGGRYSDKNLRSPSHDLPAGFMHEFLTHLCYLGLAFSGWGYDNVSAVWSRRTDGLSPWDDLDARLVSDGCVTQLKFSSVTAVNCINVQVRGTAGSAEAEITTPFVRVTQHSGGQLSPYVQQVKSGWGLIASGVRAVRDKALQRGGYEGLRDFLDQTYAAVRDGRPVPVDRRRILATAQLIDDLLTERTDA